jgi:hypothetical protein
VQVDPLKPVLNAPGFPLLTLRYDGPLSDFAFNLNLRRYIKTPLVPYLPAVGVMVGWCRLTLSIPR